MKTFIAIITLVLALGMTLVGCGGDSEQSETINSDTSVLSDVSNEEVTSESTEDVEINIAELKQGDEVSIVGQVASSTLVNGNTLWVQVKQSDGEFVLYHCQLKDEYIEQGETLKMLDVAKIKGLFLSYYDLEMENTMPVVTLYDCEIK